MAKIYFYALKFLLLFLLHISSASQCVKQDHCTCYLDEYSFINLSNLHPIDKTFFQDSQGDVSYFFSGCQNKDFNPKDYNLIANHTILGVSLVKCISTVQHHNATNATSNDDYFAVNQTCSPIGNAKDIKFELIAGSPKDYQILYVNNTSNASLSSIRLVCDNVNITDLKISSSDTDVLRLYSPLVCVQYITYHELSSGSIFCIILFVTAIVYFIGGGLIMYLARGARGVEVIPNLDFWVALPGLMKDGLIYILSGCRPFTVSSAETYDRI